MKEKLKDIKTSGSFVYAHILPNKLVYFGHSKQQPYRRWVPSHYTTTVLYPFIIEYGWKNIQHIVIQDGLTEKEAKIIENILIKQGKKDGLCINKFNGILDRKEYERERSKRRMATDEKYKEFQKKYKVGYQRKLRKKPEMKVYYRVRDFNRYHPDQIKETPLEAKTKYLQWGYIPDYIKSDDL